jgi:hypothetical protein
LLVVSKEEVEGGADISTVIFHTRTSREASRAFLTWLREREGRATKKEVSEFADALNKGELGPTRLSRSNFYASVLRTFVRVGLIAVVQEFDPERRRVRQVYHVLTQPIPERRPSGPSLILNAHLVAEIWNKQFEAGQSQ